MSGPTVIVRTNAQDGVGNTMNGGEIVVHGQTGDVLGYGMRGGKVFVRDDVGYRVGIYMKAYLEQVPVIVVGGGAGNFLGEYMAGGIVIVLGLRTPPGEPVAGDYLGTGMHGGVMYLRGPVSQDQLGAEVGVERPNAQDHERLESILSDFCGHFGLALDDLFQRDFVKLLPVSSKPYGALYAY